MLPLDSLFWIIARKASRIIGIPLPELDTPIALPLCYLIHSISSLQTKSQSETSVYLQNLDEYSFQPLNRRRIPKLNIVSIFFILGFSTCNIFWIIQVSIFTIQDSYNDMYSYLAQRNDVFFMFQMAHKVIIFSSGLHNIYYIKSYWSNILYLVNNLKIHISRFRTTIINSRSDVGCHIPIYKNVLMVSSSLLQKGQSPSTSILCLSLPPVRRIYFTSFQPNNFTFGIKFNHKFYYKFCSWRRHNQIIVNPRS